MGRRTLLLIASILVAALGTALIWLYVQGADSRAQQDSALVPVLVAGAAAPAGSTLDQAAPVPKAVPADVAVDSVRSAGDVTNLRLRTGVTPGQLLLKSMFEQGSPSQVASGKVYVAVTISDPHRVPALLARGNHVAVYVLTNQANDRLRLVMDDVVVATLGATTANGPSGVPVPATLVGFEVQPQDSAKLMNIETYGQPVLALLGEGAKGAPPTGP